MSMALGNTWPDVKYGIASARTLLLVDEMLYPLCDSEYLNHLIRAAKHDKFIL